MRKIQKESYWFPTSSLCKEATTSPCLTFLRFPSCKKIQGYFCGLLTLYTAISRKVVGKSARDNTERYCGWLWGHCSSEKFERMVREASDICLRVLKESNKSRFNSFSRYEQCIDHIPYYLLGLSRAHFLRQPFSKQLYKIGALSLPTDTWKFN